MRSLRVFLPLAVLLLSQGCAALHVFAPTASRRGQMADPEAVNELIPGTSTRADVTSLLGTPTARAAFDDNTWLYIGQVTATRIGRTPGINEQRVLVLKFDQGGTLRDVKTVQKSDARDVAMAAGETPSPGSEANFMQQLLGNVGRFTPAGLPGAGSPIGTGANSGVGFGSNTGNTLR